MLAACAGQHPRPTPHQPSPLPPPTLPRSSIVAVLGHRPELGLDDEQVAELERLERKLEREQASIVEALPGVQRAPGGVETARRRGSGGHSRTEKARDREPTPAASVTDRLDDADTAAFMEAERALRDPQRERAREIAESYREALADARERMAKEAAAR